VLTSAPPHSLPVTWTAEPGRNLALRIATRQAVQAAGQSPLSPGEHPRSSGQMHAALAPRTNCQACTSFVEKRKQSSKE